MADHMPYSIPHRRELSEEERSILHLLISREATDRLAEIDQLKVIARCGCGACPTVLFGKEENAAPKTKNGNEIASYRGNNTEGVVVGVILMEREGEIAELEAWSPHGPDVTVWPPISALERFPWK